MKYLEFFAISLLLHCHCYGYTRGYPSPGNTVEHCVDELAGVGVAEPGGVLQRDITVGAGHHHQQRVEEVGQRHGHAADHQARVVQE